MAYKFTEKTSNIQQQTTYVLYMILSSYFHKSICNTKVLETSLRLHYREMTGGRQEKLEQQVITEVERKLNNLLPLFAEMNCEVSIHRKEGNYYLEFETGFESVSAVVDRKGIYRMRVLNQASAEQSVSA